MVAGLHQFKLYQSEIVSVGEPTLGRPTLGLERSEEPMRVAAGMFLVFTPSVSAFMSG